ncbi:MAG: AAA family ATPase [Clostridiales Family XIII bacterium]|nr:AAA family ATPase [Clostridiales Family XIII bacterium]
MLTRKITKELYLWKNRANKKPLVIKGARQVGKTFIIDAFAKDVYRHYTYINFEQTPSSKEIFDGDLDVDTLIKQISLRVRDAELVPGETLIFLDEIQSCPKARTALKFFAIDNRFDVIASGSLLGIEYKEVSSLPVGYTDQLIMYSLDFEEFLWASGVKVESIADIKAYFDRKKQVPEAMHNRMMELFREYIVIGGMPAVVNEFVNSNNFAEALRIQKGIVSDYLGDIAKYAKDSEKAKARACFLSVPKQLSKDYKKFQYSVVEKDGTTRKFGGSLMWLYDAGIINYCYNLSKAELPFEGNAEENVFKVYMQDTGLLISMLDDETGADIISGNLGIYKGAIFENIIADIFTKAGKKLYCLEKPHSVQIDFFIRIDGRAVPIEVKAADNVKAKSLKTVVTWEGIDYGIKLSAKNVGSFDKIDSFPLYMAMFL